MRKALKNYSFQKLDNQPRKQKKSQNYFRENKINGRAGKSAFDKKEMQQSANQSL
jgi:hypothetical protein